MSTASFSAAVALAASNELVCGADVGSEGQVLALVPSTLYRLFGASRSSRLCIAKSSEYTSKRVQRNAQKNVTWMRFHGDVLPIQIVDSMVGLRISKENVMRQRLISGFVHITEASSWAFAALGVASALDHPFSRSFWLFSCVFVVMLGLSLAMPKK